MPLSKGNYPWLVLVDQGSDDESNLRWHTTHLFDEREEASQYPQSVLVEHAEISNM